jgi:hypothetical protein
MLGSSQLLLQRLGILTMAEKLQLFEEATITSGHSSTLEVFRTILRSTPHNLRTTVAIQPI